MRIKGAGQFGGQFVILRSIFSLYVTTCDSSEACSCDRRRCHARRLSIVCVYFTGATIALLRPTSMQLPRPTSPLSLPLYHYHCTRCPMQALSLSTPLCSASPAFLSLSALHTIHAMPSSQELMAWNRSRSCRLRIRQADDVSRGTKPGSGRRLDCIVES
jgi:hypothetical protein